MRAPGDGALWRIHSPKVTRVPSARLPSSPRRVERHLRGHRVHPPSRPLDLQEHRGIDARNGAGVAADRAPVLDDVLALDVGREGRDAHARGHLEQRVLSGPDPLAADLDDLAVADVVVEHSAADAIARFEDDAVDSALGQVKRGGEPRESGAHDRDLGGSCR